MNAASQSGLRRTDSPNLHEVLRKAGNLRISCALGTAVESVHHYWICFRSEVKLFVYFKDQRMNRFHLFAFLIWLLIEDSQAIIR